MGGTLTLEYRRVFALRMAGLRSYRPRSADFDGSPHPFSLRLLNPKAEFRIRHAEHAGRLLAARGRRPAQSKKSFRSGTHAHTSFELSDAEFEHSRLLRRSPRA